MASKLVGESVVGFSGRLARWAVWAPKGTLAFLFGMALILGSGVFFLEIDPSTEKIFPKGHPAVLRFQRFRSVFGNDEFLLVAYRAKSKILTKEELLRLEALTRRIESLEVRFKGRSGEGAWPMVRAVRSLTTIPTVKFEGFPPKPSLGLLYKGDIAGLSEKELEESNRAVEGLPFTRPLFLSVDGYSTALIVEPNRTAELSEKEGEELTHEMVKSVRRIVDEDLRSKGFESYVAGSPVVKVDIVSSLRKDLVIFTLPLLLLAGIVAFFVFRSFHGVLLPMMVISLTSLCLMGLMGLMGYEIRPMTALLPPLMLVVGVADSIHVLVELENEWSIRHGSRENAVIIAVTQVLPPCFVTSLTTFIGFGSLVLSDIVPVAEFGAFAAFGTVLAFFVTFLLMPSYWLLFGPKDLRSEGEALKVGAPRADGLASFVMKWSTVLAIVSVVLGLSSMTKLKDISFNTDYVGFFGEDTDIRRGVAFIQKEFAGIGALELVIEGPEGCVRDPEVIAAMWKVEREIEAFEEVDAAYSLADFLAFARRRVFKKEGVPESRAELKVMERIFRQLSGEREEMRSYVSEKEDMARITARIKTMGSLDLIALLERVRGVVKTHFGERKDIKVEPTGTPVIFSETAQFMLDGQLRSFYWALLAITLVLIVSLRSLRLGLLSLIPNIFPIAVTFGSMSLLGIPLNSFNSMVASVAIGIAVDDTIHVLVGFKRFRRDHEIDEALRETLSHTGAAVLSTSAMLACGFGILCLGSFKPTAHFGVLTCISIISAVIGDLFILPALLKLDERLFGACMFGVADEGAAEESVVGAKPDVDCRES